MSSVATLLRYPLKAHGREKVEQAELIAGQSMPWDRIWAVTHEAARIKDPDDGWQSCANFTRAAGTPQLMAITASLDEETETLTLTHPDRPELSVQPDLDPDTFLEWVRPLMKKGRAGPTGILRLDGRGFTDSDFASVSLCNLASHRAVEDALGKPLSVHRWRGNMWIDGLSAWEEFDWVGRELRIGEAVLHVRERITRCMATTANPETGERDADTLTALKHFGNQEFAVCAEVKQGGMVRTGDTIEVL